MKKDNEDTKEEFCSSCAMGVVAIAGAVGAGAGASSKKMHKKYKKILIWSGIITFIITIAITIYMWKKNCRECR